jgi:biopolymer transport protein TolR
MSVDLPGGGGGGRTRNVAASLNLVPFIDLLSVCITFLMVTAVWTQISAMRVDQAISDPNAQPVESDQPPVPPITVHIRADGLWMGRNIETGKNYPKTGEDYDWFALETDMKADRTTYPDENLLVIVTDDGQNYGDMIKTLDLSRTNGYTQTLLGGGPATAAPMLVPAEGGGASAGG